MASSKVLFLFLFSFAFIFSLAFISAASMGYGNPNLPNLQAPTSTGTTTNIYNSTNLTIVNTYNNNTYNISNNFTTPMDYTNVMMANKSNNLTGNLMFDGGDVTAYVSVPASTGSGIYADGTSTGLTTAFTTTQQLPLSFSGWIKIASDNPDNAGIITKYAPGSGSGFNIFMDGAKKFHAWFYAFGYGGSEAVSTTSINDGAWHFFVVTMDMTGYTKIYIDNVLEGEDAWTGATGLGSETDQLILGNYANIKLKGTLDEISIWKRVLTPAEGTTMWNGGVGKYTLVNDYLVSVPTRVTPIMTNNTAPSGEVTASDYYVAGGELYKPYRAFNDIYSGDDAWFSDLTGTYPKWLQYKFATPTIVNTYIIHTRSGAGNDGRKPKSWNFLGSNDNITWVVLDTQVNQFNANSYYQNLTYSFSNTNTYSYYKINISADNGATFCAIGELVLTAGATTQQTQGLALWHMDENADTTAASSFTPAITATFAGSGNSWVTGKVATEEIEQEVNVMNIENGALSGENGRVSIGDPNGRLVLRGSNVTSLSNFTAPNFFGTFFGIIGSAINRFKGWFTDIDVNNNVTIGGNLTVKSSTKNIFEVTDGTKPLVNVSANLYISGNLSVKRSYWNGYDNSTQAFINTANTQIINISNNNNYDAYGIHVTNNQNMTFDMTGDYLCILSPEFFQDSGTNKIITFWYQKNGVDVAWSNSRYTISNGDYFAPAVPFQFDIENPATDYIRFMWYSDSTNTKIYSSGALTSPTRPSIPGIILNCQKISELTP